LTYVELTGEREEIHVVDLQAAPAPRGSPERKILALTFDCAWVERKNAMDIVSGLRRQGIRATFFISGPFLFKDPTRGRSGGYKRANFAIIKRLIDDGHEFGNHATLHVRPSRYTDWSWEIQELQAGWDAVVREIYGAHPPSNSRMQRVWRAPFGDYDEVALREAARSGFPYHVGWNVSTAEDTGRPDCRAPGRPARWRTCWDAGRSTDRILHYGSRRRFELGAIVVLAHLSNLYLWGSHPDGIDELVAVFGRRGYRFGTVGDVIRALPELGSSKIEPPLVPFGSHSRFDVPVEQHHFSKVVS
jgi:peptidoglycan/xylan/chitin deacetylase (PgdA/CDA1 family)